MNVSEQYAPLCTECAYLILLVDAGIVLNEHDRHFTLSQLADDMGIANITHLAEELVASGVVAPEVVDDDVHLVPDHPESA